MFGFGKKNLSPPSSSVKTHSSSLELSDFDNDENCNSVNVNTTKRTKLSKRASTNFSFPNLPCHERKEVEDLIKQLQNELQIKESVISNLGEHYNYVSTKQLRIGI
jgi:hypothetical protein